MISRRAYIILGVATAAVELFCVPLAQAQILPDLTPQQQQALYLRALQMRGRRGVQSGYPQDIPLGTPLGASGVQQQPATQTTKDSTKKRAEARKAREEKKRAAQEAAQAKKAKAANKANKQPAAKAVKQLKKADAEKDGK